MGRKIKTVLAALGLVALLSGNFDNGLRKNDLAKVTQAQLIYSSKPVESKGFWNCSAVIMDYGDEAVFAHAWPTSFDAGRFWGSLEEQYRREGYPLITVDNVVEEIGKEAKRNDLEKGEAIVIGYNEEVQIVVNDLRKKGIKIRKVLTREDLRKESCAIDVIYDPATDYLEINDSDVWCNP
jgi:hypothetical protein